MPTALLHISPRFAHDSTTFAIRDTPCTTLAISRTSHISFPTSSGTKALSMDYSLLLSDEFDLSSSRRHLPQARLTFQHMDQEMKQRYIALQIIQRRDIWNPKLAQALATIYIMLLEDDGRNEEQIVRAGLPTFVSILLLERLLEGTSSDREWPLENDLNTLAMAMFWLLNSRDRLDQETDELRKEIMTRLAPTAFAGFRYPCSIEPEDLFLAPQSTSRDNIRSCTNYPADRSTEITVEYYGQPTTLRLPPIAISAILCYFVRIEYFRIKAPLELPIDRQDASARGYLCGPTRVDIDDLNIRCVTRLPSESYGDPFDELLKSRRHDPDWHRSLSGCFPPQSHPLVHYIPGTFSGRWQGSYIAPYQEDYQSMFYSVEAPSSLSTFGRWPLYVRFREFYCYSPSIPLPVAEDEISFFNAFLPLGCRWHEDELGIEFIGANDSFRTRYTPLRRSRDPIEVSSGLDIIIAGVTEAQYTAAWNGYKYIGRVRPSDGLVVLLREPLDPLRVDLGRALFRGYVTSSRNFVGRWRHIASVEQPAAWECIFSLCKEVKMPS